MQKFLISAALFFFALSGCDTQKNKESAGEKNTPTGEAAGAAHGEGKKTGKAYMEENAKTAGVVTTSSGLQYRILQKGEGGEKPGPNDLVTVHYEGTLLDGEVFDSSYERGQPATFPLSRVIPGWTEGLQLMSPGDIYGFVIPADLAYGEQGTPGGPIGPNEVLNFKVELLDFKKIPGGILPGDDE